ncbi:MAG: bifunctional DNA-formamidopyrimidine glycosylase/DNA-(apurinic or apyrimidinic site) lyase [Planctomycetota bacterium]|nr:bifunctional DNA-formamidopyrimidine glycosylase/DNA-(apurinic or apyrimidinic site) lyase [Planctomycetota bacterium]MDI6787373.1 bifunctional DNA-formamidopyrimidine glycosylase/DNA-(apurinic or apyrimidinic site) lyase [Planctomycetota bacterium]
MPELPEVETICRGLRKYTLGLKIKDVSVFLPKIINLPVNHFRKTVIGMTITSVTRRAKTIIITLSNGYSLLIHLKISGRLLYLPATTPIEKHTHLIFSAEGGSAFGGDFKHSDYQLRFWDLRRFGYVKLFDEEDKKRFLEKLNLGPEPLEKDFTLNRFRQLLHIRPNSRIKPLLMDQTFISGIGNLYADEILFHSRVHPLRKVSSLTDKEINKIHQGIGRILRLAIEKRGSSVELYVDLEGKPGGFVPYIKAYDREGNPCARCLPASDVQAGKNPIKRIKIGSRSAYFCPRCQNL